MTRVTSPSLLLSLLLPVAAPAQVPPVPAVPVVPPAPVAAPVAPVAPVPPAPSKAPRAIVAPKPAPMPMPKPVFGDDFTYDFVMPEFQIDTDAISAKFEAAQAQLYALRDQKTEMGQQIAEQARQAAEQARQNVQANLDKMRADMAARSTGRSFGLTSQDSPASASYRGGLDALQQRQYDRAIVAFDRVIGQKGDRADAALYWKAFAQFKLARTEDALGSIAQLRKDHAQSRYLNEAKVLEADVRKASGQPVNPAAADDDEIKLLAIQGLSKSDQAVPLLEGVLTATNSLSVKKRALYVLALSDDARAHQVLMRYAKGGGNPDLQVEAIRYLASRKDSKTTPTELLDVYNSSTDVNVRLAVIDAYRTWGDKPALIRISGDRTAIVDVRRSAMSRLNGLADVQDIMTLYQQEPDASLRMQLVGVLQSMNAYDQLASVAKSDKDQGVRIRAIRALGSPRNERGTQLILGLYSADADKDVRRAVIQALMSQNNAEALVTLARKETDLDLKRELVRRLSDMAPNNKAAENFMMEQLK